MMVAPCSHLGETSPQNLVCRCSPSALSGCWLASEAVGQADAKEMKSKEVPGEAATLSPGQACPGGGGTGAGGRKEPRTFSRSHRGLWTLKPHCPLPGHIVCHVKHNILEISFGSRFPFL